MTQTWQDWQEWQKSAAQRMRKIADETKPPSAAQRIWGRQPLDGNASREAAIAAGRAKK